MQFSIPTILLLALTASAAVLPRAPQNGNRPTPTGTCCVANTSLKQDVCTASNGSSGRCVPGGNDCGSSLSCVEDANLTCDANVIERGSPLCRANAPFGNGGLFDGANIIQSLADATVN